MKFDAVRLIISAVLVLTGSLLISSPLLAADEKSKVSQTSMSSKEKDSNSQATLEKAAGDIEEQKKAIRTLEQQVKQSKGITRVAFEARLDRAWMKLLEQNLAYADVVLVQQKAGSGTEPNRKLAIEILKSQSEVANATIERIRSRIVVPEPGLSAAEQASAYAKLFNVLNTLGQAYALMIRSLELSRAYEIDVENQVVKFSEKLADRAANVSVLLEMEMENVTALRASTSAVPDDTEVKSKLSVAMNNVRGLANLLSTLITLMESMKMEAGAYREQVLAATGQITTDVFEVGVITNLILGWGQTLWNVVIKDGPNLVFKVLLFLLIVFGFWKLAGIIQGLIERALERSELHVSELLRRMMVSLVRNLIILLGILIALSQIGITLGPLLAGLGVVGFVVGFALQDSLSNFASGMMILVYRPFDVGDLIEAGGVSGTVSHMSLVNTTILTLDNQTIVVPNNKIWGDVVKNVTAQTMRRIDMMFGVSYSDDISKTERVLQDIVDSHNKILADPAPVVRLHELGDSSVNFIVRPWVKKEDYWEVYWDVTRTVKLRFDEEGISIPFPQRDVHMYNHNI